MSNQPETILKKLLNYYPNFITRLPETTQYKFVNTISKQFLPLKILLEKLRLQENLDRPIQIWKEQNEAYDYSIFFRINLNNLKSVKIYKENWATDDELIYQETYNYADETNEFFYEYITTSENEIPSTHYYITVETYDEYSFTKGFPENDRTVNDHLNISRELNNQGLYNITFSTNNLKSIKKAQILVNNLITVDEVFNPDENRPYPNNWSYSFSAPETEILNSNYTFIITYTENNKEYTERISVQGNKFYPDIYDHDYALDNIGRRSNFPRSNFVPYTDNLNFTEFYTNTEPSYNNCLTEDDYHYANRLKYYLTNLDTTDLPILELYKFYGVISELVNRDTYLAKQDITYMRSGTCPDDGDGVKLDTTTSFTSTNTFNINREKKIIVVVLEKDTINIVSAGNVTFKITDSNGKEYRETVKIQNNRAVLKYTPSVKGIITVTALFEGTSKYNSSIRTSISNVKRIPVNVHGLDVKGIFGTNVFLSAYVSSGNKDDNITGTIDFSINGKDVTSNLIGYLENPNWHFDYKNEAITQYLIPFTMNPGSYQVKATYSGDDYFAPNYGEFTLRVTDSLIQTELTYLFLMKDYIGLRIFDEDFNFLNDKTIKILLNNQSIDSIVSRKTKYIITSKPLPSYTSDDTITAVFEGDETHEKSSCIIYPTPQEILIDTPSEPIETFFNDVFINPSLIAFRLHDAKGKVLDNQTVTLKKNSTLIKTVITTKGWTIINNIPSFNNNDILTLNFEGVEDFYLKSSAVVLTNTGDLKTSKIVLNTDKLKVNTLNKIKATLTDKDNNPITNAKVKFTINNTTKLTGLTNTDGIVSVDYTSLTIGVYPLLIEYEGDTNYESSNLLTKLTVSTGALDTFFNYIFINPQYVLCGLHDANGTSLSNTDVKVQKNGTTISGGAVSTGTGKHWTHVVRLPNYTESDIITLYYPGSTDYNTVTAQVYPVRNTGIPDEPTTQLTTTLTLTSSKNSITTDNTSDEGKSVLTATLIDSNNDPVIGRYLKFYDGTTVLATSQTDEEGKARYTYTCAKITSSPEIRNIKAVFEGTSGYATSTSEILDINVTSVNTSNTNITLLIDYNNLFVGSTYDLTAIVTSKDGTPITSGKVYYYRGDILIGYANLNTGGKSIFKYTPTSVENSKNIQLFKAVYEGNNVYDSCTSSVVKRYIYISTVLSLTANPTSCSINQNVNLEATLKSSTNNLIVGRIIDFKCNGSHLAYGTTNTEGIATLPAPTTKSTAGTYVYSASYSGDSGYNNSTSNNVNVTYTATTKINTNILCNTNIVYCGEYIYATLTDENGNPLSDKNVYFTLTSNLSKKYTATSMGNGVYRLFIELNVQNVTFTASFDGDENYNKATPNSTTLTVKQHTSTIKLVPESHTLTNGENLGVYLYDDKGKPISGASVYINTYNLTTDNDGYAYITLNLSIPGSSRTDTVKYGYNGSTYVSGDSKETTVVTYPKPTVTKLTPTVTLTSDTYNVANGNYYTLTATLNTTSATGTVTFYQAGTNIGTANISNGKASLRKLASISVNGTWNFTAHYNGDSNFNTNGSGIISISGYIPTVTKTTPSITLTSSGNSIPLGSNYSLTANLPSDCTGSVTFYQKGSASSSYVSIGTISLSNGKAVLNNTATATVGGSWYFYAHYNSSNYYNVTDSSAIIITGYDTKITTITGAPTSMSPGDTFTVYLKDYQGNPIIGQHVSIKATRTATGANQTQWGTTATDGSVSWSTAWNYEWVNETITVTVSYGGISGQYNANTSMFTVHWN